MSEEQKPAARLWDRGDALDQVVERFTVGRDPELDLRLTAHDALGSAAHARMLARIGVLQADELAALTAELAQIVDEARAGRFCIPQALEDCHTAIETRLTERLGQTGKRIHTGRSRNDQVIAALRLWAREALLDVAALTLDLADQLADLAQAHQQVSVPGYTHTRQAMPSTMGLLLGAHAETLLDAMPWLRAAHGHLNRSPLGSASGYGVSLPLDRQYVADLLGMDSVQANTLAVQNDRGKTELLVLGAALTPALDMGRLASDLIWFSSEDLGYVRLGHQVTTGSSIMPQKRNPDVLELIRASVARVRARHAEIGAVFSPLPSGYHRDLQLTKEPFVEGMQICLDVLAAMQPALASLEVDPAACRAAMQRAIGATDVVFARVAAGQPFRAAYKEVAADPAGAVSGDPAELWRQRTHLGAPGALDLDPARQRCAAERGWVQEQRQRVAEVWRDLLGSSDR